jgi:hypothetical protein
VFTHLYPQIAGGESARVAVGRRVEIQLPGDPTVWTSSVDGNGVRRRGGLTVYPSIGQYEGASAVFSFPFKAIKRGSTTITLDGAPSPPGWLEDPFVLTLEE